MSSLQAINEALTDAAYAPRLQEDKALALYQRLCAAVGMHTPADLDDFRAFFLSEDGARVLIDRVGYLCEDVEALLHPDQEAA